MVVEDRFEQGPWYNSPSFMHHFWWAERFSASLLLAERGVMEVEEGFRRGIDISFLLKFVHY